MRLTLGSTVTTVRGGDVSQARRRDKQMIRERRTVAETGGMVVGGASSQNLGARTKLARVGVGRGRTMDERCSSSGRGPL